MKKTQQTYKRKFDERTRRLLPALQVGEFVFLRKEYCNPQKKRIHKFFSIANGPYQDLLLTLVRLSWTLTATTNEFRGTVFIRRLILLRNLSLLRLPIMMLQHIGVSQNSGSDCPAHSVLMHPHRGLSGPIDAEKTPSISPVLPRVIDRRSLRVPTPLTGQPPGPALLSKKE